MLRSALALGIMPASLPMILAAGQRLAEKLRSKKFFGMKLAGHELKGATEEKRLSKVQATLFIPKVQKITVSKMSLRLRCSISIGIHSVSRSQKKWVQQAMEN